MSPILTKILLVKALISMEFLLANQIINAVPTTGRNVKIEGWRVFLSKTIIDPKISRKPKVIKILQLVNFFSLSDFLYLISIIARNDPMRISHNLYCNKKKEDIGFIADWNVPKTKLKIIKAIMKPKRELLKFLNKKNKIMGKRK